LGGNRRGAFQKVGPNSRLQGQEFSGPGRGISRSLPAWGQVPGGGAPGACRGGRFFRKRVDGAGGGGETGFFSGGLPPNRGEALIPKTNPAKKKLVFSPKKRGGLSFFLWGFVKKNRWEIGGAFFPQFFQGGGGSPSPKGGNAWGPGRFPRGQTNPRSKPVWENFSGGGGGAGWKEPSRGGARHRGQN